MPHSSGGGSHGGGSHHSSGGGSSHSHSSGGGSGGSIDFTNTRVSNKPYRFCSTYCYYQNNKPVYIYADYGAKDRKTSAGQIIGKIIVWLLICPMFFITFIWMISGCINKPKKLSGKYDNTIIIEDNIDVISKSEEKELKSVLKDFYKKTGIVPAVVTVTNEEWQEDYNSMEAYAFADYLERFNDEKHWLIVYSEPEDPDPDFLDWRWEGMQGNDTDDILTNKKADEFTEELQKGFLKEDTSVGKALITSFENVSAKAMKTEVRVGLLIFSLFPAGIAVFLTIYFFDIHPFKKAKLKKAFKVSNDSKLPKEQTCKFCGGIYVVGCHLECPHCGGALEAHDYTVDEQGNVKEVLN